MAQSIYMREDLSGLEDTIEFPPENPAKEYNSAAITSYVGGEFTEAGENFSKAIEAYPCAALYRNRSANFVALGKPSAFVAALYDAERSIELDPNSSLGWFRKGVALRCLRKFKRSAEAFTTGSRLRSTEEVLNSSVVSRQSALHSRDPFDVAMEEIRNMKSYESDTEDIPLEVQAASNPDHDKFDDLFDWISEKSYFPYLYTHQYSENNRGVHLRASVPENTEILAVALDYLITGEVARECPLVQTMMAAQIDPNLSAARHCYLATFILYDRLNPDSFFQPYYKILPESYDNVPLNWKPEELEWLKGSYLLQQVEDKRENFRNDYDLMCLVCPEFRQFTFEEFCWSRLVVSSRVFGIMVDGARTEALVPVADMLNHYRPRQTRWYFDSRRREFLIVSMHPLQAGAQVFDSYGKKCNSRFLLNYGFTVEHNYDVDGNQHHNEARILLPSIDSVSDENGPADILSIPELVELYTSILAHRNARLSIFFSADGTQFALSYMRILCASLSELFRSHLLRRDIFSIPPMLPATELRVLQRIADACKDALAQYPTTLAADKALLQDPSLEYGSNRRNAVVLTHGEKEIYQYYVDLVDKVRPVYEMPAMEALQYIRSREDSEDDVDRYLLQVAYHSIRLQELLASGLADQ